MINRYATKFSPAVSQKEPEKALHALFIVSGDTVLEPGQQAVVDKVTVLFKR
jgi:hypothetical protein